jgi:hypothetical protein
MLYINSIKASFNKALYYKINADNIISDKLYSLKLSIKYLNKKLEF